MIKNYWKKWKILAEKIGDFQFNLIFSLLYFILITPIGIITNYFYDFMNLEKFPIWEKIDNQNKSLKELKNQ